jgi:oligopeptide/dipeptide ABC transporter ATP-binding protein
MSDVLLSATGVSVTYGRQAIPALRNARLAVPEGAAIGIVGESGSGKTTLARALVGALEPSQGEILISGVPWARVKRNDPLRRTVQMIFQDPLGSLNPSLNARQTVAEVFRFWDDLSRAEANTAAEALLREVGLGPDVLDSRPARLSGGQCQRIGIARALACGPRVLVADEPTSALDVSVQAQILNLLDAERKRRSLALVLVSHDLDVVRHSTDHVLVMYGGCVIEEGPTMRVLTNPSHPYTRALVDSRPGRAPVAAPMATPSTTTGCVYSARCMSRQDDCLVAQPALINHGATDFACLHPLDATDVSAGINS